VLCGVSVWLSVHSVFFAVRGVVFFLRSVCSVRAVVSRFLGGAVCIFGVVILSELYGVLCRFV